jgi:hypothetical protein
MIDDFEMRRQIAVGLHNAGLPAVDADKAAEVAVAGARCAVDHFTVHCEPLQGQAWLNATIVGLQLMLQITQQRLAELRTDAEKVGIEQKNFVVGRAH